jgi:uncharacterized protein DUF4440
MAQNEVIAVEEQGWEALSSSGEAGRTFYERVLDSSVVMLLPGGLVMDEREAIVEAMSGPPWSSYELQGLRAFQPTPDTAVVIYGVVAERDAQTYSALMSSSRPSVACANRAKR